VRVLAYVERRLPEEIAEDISSGGATILPWRDRGLASLATEHDLGSGGHITWNRDDLHER
jgi:hypothetical protein